MDGITLAGTLTLPDNPIAGVILISGSGPQERDQLYMGHKTFWVLADHLSRHQIAVLRYDDRGVGMSGGHFEGANSYDFANDASAAIDFLQSRVELNGKNIGAIGHSEGGLIAPVTASQNDKLAFMVLMAGPSRSGQFISENQMRSILLSNGMSKDTAVAGSQITAALNRTVLSFSSLTRDKLKTRLTQTYQKNWQALSEKSKNELKSLGGGSLTEARLNSLTSHWYSTFLSHQPSKYLNQANQPILALFGENDVQINTKDHITLMTAAIESTGNPLSEVKVLPNHNHLFQLSNTGAMTEYQRIEETLSQQALSVITQWIQKLD